MVNKVEICGVNTAKLPVLSNEEKTELLKRIKNGDQKAREEFVNGNLKLVLSVIKRFYGRGENLDDLFQIGCIGLIKAMDNFDLSQNVQFSTYAVPMIIGEIRRYLRDNNMVRVSRSVRDLAYKVLAIRERIQKEEQREANTEEIARELGSSAGAYAFARMQFPGRDILFYLYLFSMMVPTVTNLIPQFLLMKDLHLVDSYLGLLLIYIGIGVPSNTFFLRNFFLSLPKELEEAVIIDGGNRWQIYWKMVLPLSKPALGTFAILAYSNVWDEFLIALTMIKTPEKRTLPIALRLFQGQNLNNWGLIFAASLIAVLPILLVYIVMQKKLIHGGAMDGMLKG